MTFYSELTGLVWEFSKSHHVRHAGSYLIGPTRGVQVHLSASYVELFGSEATFGTGIAA